MTPEHLMDFANRVSSSLKADLNTIIEHAPNLKDNEVNWCVAQLQRDVVFITNTLEELSNACERVGAARSRISKSE